MNIHIETELLAAELIEQCETSELIDIMESIIIALYENGFDDIKEHINELIDSFFD